MLVVIGPLVPPMTGQAVSTEAVLKRLGAERDLAFRVFNTGSGRQSGTAGTLLRLYRLTRAALGLVTSRLLYRHCNVHISANARRGMIITAVYVLLGRVLGCRLFIHYHTLVFNRNRKLATQIVRFAGSGAKHIVLCDAMSKPFRELGVTDAQLLFVSNVFMLEQAVHEDDTDLTSVDRPVTLGHFCSLAFDKGIREVFETAERLHSTGLKVRLVLAGACADKETEAFIVDALARLPYCEHLGFIPEDTKTDFFADIDFFVYPTKNDAEPIVTLEALSASVPVIAPNMGCLARIVGNGGGLVVMNTSAFVDEAESWIKMVIAETNWRARNRQRAQDQFQELCARSEKAIAALILEFRHPQHDP